MNIRQLLHSFNAWREHGRALVLATVYETAGSTYSKAGAQMLIDEAGNFQGMLSGGCLEGDLAARAAAVLASGKPQSVTFDLGGSDDGLWGLGVGCDGLMRVFLQPLNAANNYQPFAALARIYAGEKPAALAIVIKSELAAVHAGSALIYSAGALQSFGVTSDLQQELCGTLEHAAANRSSTMLREKWQGEALEILIASVQPPPRVLVLGGGLDAQPLVRLVADLGWRVTVQDHRSAYIANGDFRDAEETLSVPAADLATALDLNAFDAAIVMSHHLATDRLYLDLLSHTRIAYVGLLGPISRRQRLLADLPDNGNALSGRVHGPAGLDIGGRGPASIAVSIVAEMHQQLMRQRSGA